jgi:pimeloyl-ACP methyl ester carboxylesterase
MTTVHANGIDFRVNRLRSGSLGDRPVVVCIHGLGIVDHSSMAFTLGMPLATSFDVVLYDLRGHGRSDIVPSGYTVADHVADLVALLDVMEITRPVHLLAGSYGGSIGMVMAQCHPERVASLSLVDAHFPIPGWGTFLCWTLNAARDKFREGYTVEDIMARLKTTSRRRAAAMAARSERLLLHTTLIDDVAGEPGLTMEEYAEIRTPVLGVYGAGSPIYGLRKELVKRIPHAEVVSVEDVDHLEIFWTPATREAIREFVFRSEAALDAAEAPAGAAAPAQAGTGEARSAGGGAQQDVPAGAAAAVVPASAEPAPTEEAQAI